GVPRRTSPAGRRRQYGGCAVEATGVRTSAFSFAFDGVHRAAHYSYSETLARDMGVVVYGHYGPPMIAFPTTGGDEWEYERNGVIGAMAHAIDAGRVKVFAVNTNNSDSFGNDGAHPRHKSYMQAMYDQYIAEEVFPFVRAHCRSQDVESWTMQASRGASR